MATSISEEATEEIVEKNSMESDQDKGYFERIIQFDSPELVVANCRGENKPEISLCIDQKWDSDESGVVWDSSIVMAKYLELSAPKGTAFTGVNVIGKMPG